MSIVNVKENCYIFSTGYTSGQTAIVVNDELHFSSIEFKNNINDDDLKPLLLTDNKVFKIDGYTGSVPYFKYGPPTNSMKYLDFVNGILIGEHTG